MSLWETGIPKPVRKSSWRAKITAAHNINLFSRDLNASSGAFSPNLPAGAFLRRLFLARCPEVHALDM
ncbi:MAG TPA: hypothetical protein VGE05_12660 [Novosphingobium sp.]